MNKNLSSVKYSLHVNNLAQQKNAIKNNSKFYKEASWTFLKTTARNMWKNLMRSSILGFSVKKPVWARGL